MKLQCSTEVIQVQAPPLSLRLGCLYEKNIYSKYPNRAFYLNLRPTYKQISVLTLINIQADAARSKEVLLVKNLPAGTTSEELREVFAEHGNLGRVLMPPFGITAIIEFLSAKDAKQAFRNLAYSKVCSIF